jgi:hypothetical protein
MPETYGAHERAALIMLTLQKNRELSNPELRNDYGIELRPAGRTKLNKAGLLNSRMESRRYVHQITDDGLDWCENELANVENPPRSSPLVRAGFEVLRRMIRHLQQSGVRLVDVLSPADLESLIRSAYQQLSVKPQDWVRLAELRPKLNGADKDEVDEVLLAMTKTGLVHLAPDSDRRSLTEADHKAGIQIGKETKHLVAIEES